MAWFTRLRNWQTDQANGIGIRSDYHDQEDDNFAAGINLALNIAGNNTPTANIPMGGFKFTGAADGTVASDFATLGQAQTAIASYAVDSSGSDAYAVTMSPSVTAYTAGLRITFKVGTSNTGAATLNVNALGAKSIVKDKDTTLADNDLVLGQVHTVVYDGTNFQLQSPAYGSINQNGAAIYADDTGAANAYVVTLSPVPPAYVKGMVINFKAANANTTTSTINVNGLGLKTIFKDFGATLARGDILAFQVVQLIYDGTAFQLASPPGGSVTQNGSAIYAADAGATDAYAITLSPAISAYTTGMIINFKANTQNTGAATLNVNGLGAKSIKKSVSTDLSTADILANQLVSVIYDGTNFQMNSLLATGGGVTSVATGVGLTGGTITSSGTIACTTGVPVQAQTTSLTTASSVAVTAGTWSDAGLSVSITPSATTSRIMILAQLSMGTDFTTTGVGHARLVRGATAIDVNSAPQASQVAASIPMATHSGTSYLGTGAIVYIDSPATTSATTYKIQLTNFSSSTMYINRTPADTNSTGNARYASSITAIEIL